jgi:hypothetical protein
MGNELDVAALAAEHDREDAALAAEYYAAWRHPEHRGVEEFGHRIVVFGNDGPQNHPAVAEEVRLVREAILEAGLEEEGFAATDGSWVVVVRVPLRDQHSEVTAHKLHAVLLKAAVRAWGTLTGGSCSLTLHRGPFDISVAEFETIKAGMPPDEQASASAV